MSSITQWWASLKKGLASGNSDIIEKVQSSEHFAAGIRLEKARVDRNDHVFSLVLFEIEEPYQKVSDRPKIDSIILQSFISSLQDRVRSTDEIGWFDDRLIGVLLPYTSKSGAQKFVDDICREVDTKEITQNYNIYTYPSSWPFVNCDDTSVRSSKHQSTIKHAVSEQSTGDQLYFKDICNSWNLQKNEPLESGITQLSTRPKNNSIKDQNSSEISRTLTVKKNPLPPWKRLIDILGAVVGLSLYSPYLLIHTIILRFISPGPVFFKQERIGYKGRPFKMWKLRTMDVNVDQSIHRRHVSNLIKGANEAGSEKPMTKLDYDPHIYPGGIILRKLCIDEVPQLINVLLGEMSLVGPRPPLQYEVEEFRNWQLKRFDAIPGMTGLWQVSGKNKLTFSQMIRLDIKYSQNLSLRLDLMILLKTPFAIVSQLMDTLVIRRKQQLLVEGEHV